MKSLFTLITLVLLLSVGIPANAQTFQQCADVTQNGNVSLSDLMMMVNVFIGGPDLPAGRGDIDFRQGFNLGDVRYLNGYIFTTYPEEVARRSQPTTLPGPLTRFFYRRQLYRRVVDLLYFR